METNDVILCCCSITLLAISFALNPIVAGITICVCLPLSPLFFKLLNRIENKREDRKFEEYCKKMNEKHKDNGND